MTMEGGCFCGAARYQIDGLPRRVTCCHCRHCRRTSGAAFLAWAEFDPAKVKFISGEPSRFESRPLVTRQFCGSCGPQLTYQHAEEEDIIDVSVCSLDAPEEIEPEDHVWCDRTLPWIELADGLPRYGRSKY